MKTKKNSLILKALWNKACEFEGVPANSMFVVFSPTNPWMVEYNKKAVDVFANLQKAVR